MSGAALSLRQGDLVAQPSVQMQDLRLPRHVQCGGESDDARKSRNLAIATRVSIKSYERRCRGCSSSVCPKSMPQTIQPSQSPFNPEIRPFSVYCLLTSLLGCYRPPRSAGARPFLRPWSLSRQICRPFVFITLQIPLLACPPRRPFIFILLQIPFPARPVFSDSYKTPGGVSELSYHWKLFVANKSYLPLESTLTKVR
jgi:hypothetical protein